MDIVNYFILGKVDRINQVLMAAAQENYFGKKYSWCALSKVLLCGLNIIAGRQNYSLIILFSQGWFFRAICQD